MFVRIRYLKRERWMRAGVSSVSREWQIGRGVNRLGRRGPMVAVWASKSVWWRRRGSLEWLGGSDVAQGFTLSRHVGSRPLHSGRTGFQPFGSAPLIPSLFPNFSFFFFRTTWPLPSPSPLTDLFSLGVLAAYARTQQLYFRIRFPTKGDLKWSYSIPPTFSRLLPPNQCQASETLGLSLHAAPRRH